PGVGGVGHGGLLEGGVLAEVSRDDRPQTRRDEEPQPVPLADEAGDVEELSLRRQAGRGADLAVAEMEHVLRGLALEEGNAVRPRDVDDAGRAVSVVEHPSLVWPDLGAQARLRRLDDVERAHPRRDADVVVVLAGADRVAAVARLEDVAALVEDLDPELDLA